MERIWSSLAEDRRRSLLALACAAATLLLGLFIYSAVREAGYRAKCAEVKQNLHAIQLAVERFAVDDPGSFYPSRIEDVIARGYLAEFPVNPFTGLPMRCIEVPQVAPSDFEQLREAPPGAAPGDFFYYKRYGRDGPQATDGNPIGYSLGAYF
jgi:hypothetical protein